MTSDDLLLLTNMIVADTLWALALRRGRPERLYERKKDSPVTWYWLDVFGIPKTKQNCVRFIRRCWIAGMTLVTSSTLCGLLWQHR